jgi:hypothetical protein
MMKFKARRLRITDLTVDRMALIIPCFTILLISGCEYNSYKKNFVDIDPPTAEGLSIQIITSYTDTVKVFTDTECQFSIQGAPSGNGRVVVKIGDRTWNIKSLSGSFIVRPDSFPSGIDSLTMDIYISTGTGSISDLLGAENYWNRQVWPLVIDSRPPPKLVPVVGHDKSGFFRVQWPRCDQYNFMEYRLTIMHLGKTSIVDIYNRNKCFYLDTSYVGGIATYSLSTFVHGYSQTVDGSLVVNEESPIPQFENVGYDSVRIFWKKSNYKCKYWLTDYYNLPIFQSVTDTSVTILNRGFGDPMFYNLITSPYYYTHTVSLDPDCRLQSKMYTLGDYIATNLPSYGYNRFDKTIYTNSYEDMECYDAGTMTKKRSVRLDMLSYQGLYSAPNNSSFIAALTSKNINVFKDQFLTSPVVIQYDSWGSDVDHFALTNNGLVTIARPSRFDIISIAKGKVIASESIEKYPLYSKPKCFATSADGKYLCSVSHLGMSLFKYDPDTLIKIYSDYRAYTSVLFDEKNSDIIMLKLRGNNTLEIRKISDFSLIRTVNLFQGVMCGFDPETGYLLYSDYNNLYVLKPGTFETVLKIRCSSTFVDMYAGRLFSMSGYTLNISGSL